VPNLRRPPEENGILLSHTYLPFRKHFRKSCYYHIRQHRCIRPYLDSKTAFTIATSIVYSTLHYCNFLYHNLPRSEITRLQQIQHSLARAAVKAPKKEIMQGTMPGARRRGSPRTAWVDNIRTLAGLPVEESVRMTEDRDKRRK